MDTSPKLSGSRRYPKHSRSINTMHLKRLLVLMATRPYTRWDLIDETGLAQATVLRYLQILHRGPDNLIYVSGHEQSTHGRWRELFSLGFRQPDVPPKEPKRIRGHHAAKSNLRYGDATWEKIA